MLLFSNQPQRQSQRWPCCQWAETQYERWNQLPTLSKNRKTILCLKEIEKNKGRVSPVVVPVGKGMHFKSYLKNLDLSVHPAILLAHFSKSFHWFRCWELDTFMIFFFALYWYSSDKSMVDQVYLHFLMFFAEWHASQEMLHKRWALLA